MMSVAGPIVPVKKDSLNWISVSAPGPIARCPLFKNLEKGETKEKEVAMFVGGCVRNYLQSKKIKHVGQNSSKF